MGSYKLEELNKAYALSNFEHVQAVLLDPACDINDLQSRSRENSAS